MKIDSKNKKIVIFSDVHNDFYRVKKIVKEECADLNICLGDWFDSFDYDTPKDYKDTASYLLEYLNDEKNISLWGNHDVHYLSDNKTTLCSGYENWKYIDIDEMIGNNRGNLQKKFKWFVRIDDWLCTHGGLHASHLPASFYLKTNTNIIDIAKIDLRKTPLLYISFFFILYPSSMHSINSKTLINTKKSG